uniref:Uncharacterized protein n=1 Tax=Arundo donax TaxID=35708 RepID=A0A0A9A8S6_ARUDO
MIKLNSVHAASVVPIFWREEYLLSPVGYFYCTKMGSVECGVLYIVDKTYYY